MRVFALNDVVGNWDSYGNSISATLPDGGKNMYAYKPPGDRWRLLLWDMDVGTGSGFSLPTDEPLFIVANDPNIARMYNTPALVRAYWRAIKDAVSGPMLAANYNPVMDGHYSALQANDIRHNSGPVASPGGAKSWIDGRLAFLNTQLTTVASPFEISNNGGNNFSTSAASVVLTGRAPVEAKTVQVTGATVTTPLTWPAITTWNVTVALQMGANTITVQGIDRFGNSLNNPPGAYTDSIVITRE